MELAAVEEWISHYHNWFPPAPNVGYETLLST